MDEKTKKLVAALLEDIIATSEDEDGGREVAMKVIDWSEDAVKILEQLERDA